METIRAAAKLPRAIRSPLALQGNQGRDDCQQGCASGRLGAVTALTEEEGKDSTLALKEDVASTKGAKLRKIKKRYYRTISMSGRPLHKMKRS